MAVLKEKIYKVRKYDYNIGKNNIKPIETEGTLEELTEYFTYTLECGKQYEKEKGNRKISVKPKSIESLIKNVNNAFNNSASNGCAGKWIELVE